MNRLIEYNNIDIEIRHLVHLINKFDGIITLFSCSGHEFGEPGYITVKSESQNAIEKLLNSLPKKWHRSGFNQNQPFSKYIWVNAELMPEYGLVYTIRFQGDPFYIQRELCLEIEQSLENNNSIK